jgi:hypothetical protein
LSEDEVRTIAESFIKKVQASKWEQVVFRDAQPFTKYYYKEKPQLPDGYTFNWTRVARDGIQYPDNGFTVTVDALTEVMIRGSGLEVIAWDLGIILAGSVLFMAFNTLLLKKYRRI